MEHNLANPLASEHHWKYKTLNWLLLACLVLAIPFFGNRLAFLADYYLIAILLLFCFTIIFAIRTAIQHHDYQRHVQESAERRQPNAKLQGGLPTEEEVKQKLSKAGWHPHAIGLILNDLHNPDGSIARMQQFINHQLLKGRLPEEIKKMLLDADWPEELVDVGLF